MMYVTIKLAILNSLNIINSFVLMKQKYKLYEVKLQDVL